MKRVPVWVVAAFAIALAVFGTVGAVYAFAGEGTYRDFARGRGQVTFTVGDATLKTDESGLVDLHRQTLAYVLGEGAEPARCCGGRSLFDANESAHLADVRAVFAAVRIAWIVSALALVALLIRGRRGGDAAPMVRNGALWAAAAVLVVGIIAAFAFEPAFLAFHQLFFPQGNFLFDPATSNLLRLYPEEYWYGVTLRVGIAFVASALLLAGAAWLVSRSAIVTRR